MIRFHSTPGTFQALRIPTTLQALISRVFDVFRCLVQSSTSDNLRVLEMQQMNKVQSEVGS